MTRYRYFTATTLDGYLADEHDSLDWLFRQPQHENSPFGYGAFIAEVGALVMGATTYRWIIDHGRRTGSPWEYSQRTFVFSHQELDQPPPGVERVSGSPAEFRDALRAAAGDQDVWVVGGGRLAADFASAGMLDEIIVSIAPVTLGSGRPLFGGAVDLRLEESGTSGAFLCARYSVVGPLLETQG